MTSFWGLLIGFLAVSALGALFCNVLLTVYEQRKDDMDIDGDPQVRAVRTQRLIFRWSLGAGIVIGVLTTILRLLPSN